MNLLKMSVTMNVINFFPLYNSNLFLVIYIHWFLIWSFCRIFEESYIYFPFLDEIRQFSVPLTKNVLRGGTCFFSRFYVSTSLASDLWLLDSPVTCLIRPWAVLIPHLPHLLLYSWSAGSSGRVFLYLSLFSLCLFLVNYSSLTFNILTVFPILTSATN